jgi:hypothetical protein
MNLQQIKQAIAHDKVRVTSHADDEMAADGLFLDILLQATLNGETIEDYPMDHPLPSCLVLGFTKKGEPVHSVWAYNELTERAVLITVYRPDPERWYEWRIRKG